MRTLSLVVPVYNAPVLAARLASHIPAFARLAREAGFVLIETLFVDDGSQPPLPSFPDASGEPHLIRHPANLGKGAAVRTGALAARGEWVLMSDVDESAPLAEFVRLAEAAQDGTWMVCGSRWRRPGVPLVRRLLSALFRLPVRFAGVTGIHDTQCGFKLFHMPAMRPFFERLRITRFAFDVELIRAAQQAGGNVNEVCVKWQGRHRSSLRIFRDAPRMLWDVLRLRGPEPPRLT